MLWRGLLSEFSLASSRFQSERPIEVSPRVSHPTQSFATKSQPMLVNRIAVIDVETTGLRPWGTDRIIELAIVVVSANGEILQEYDTLLNPERDIGPTSIHRISAGDVRLAPRFREIAGDVLQVLTGITHIAGHNISFDLRFLVSEYQRLGVEIPNLPAICTYQQLGRTKLLKCCEEHGIPCTDSLHRALTDARATAQLIAHLCTDNPTLLEEYHCRDINWPVLPILKTPQLSRDHVVTATSAPPGFLQRLSGMMHHDVEASPANVLVYLAIIDRVLEDRLVDSSEETILVESAQKLQLTQSQLLSAHSQYLQSLAAVAISDGQVTDAERRDLHLVARLLGQDVQMLDYMLDTATQQLAAVSGTPTLQRSTEHSLVGLRVCFTGELLSSINGSAVTRDLAESLAIRAGLHVAASVTKKLDILVVADPHSQSMKARKAREYGTRIIAETVFWRMLGVTMD